MENIEHNQDFAKDAEGQSRLNVGLGDAPICPRCKKPMAFIAQGYSDELASEVNLYHCDAPCWTQKRIRVSSPNVEVSGE